MSELICTIDLRVRIVTFRWALLLLLRKSVGNVTISLIFTICFFAE